MQRDRAINDGAQKEVDTLLREKRIMLSKLRGVVSLSELQEEFKRAATRASGELIGNENEYRLEDENCSSGLVEEVADKDAIEKAEGVSTKMQEDFASYDMHTLSGLDFDVIPKSFLATLRGIIVHIEGLIAERDELKNQLYSKEKSQVTNAKRGGVFSWIF